MEIDKAIIIRDKTRLEQLIERFNSKAQARFYIERSGQDFPLYEQEHEVFYQSLKQVQDTVARWLKYKVLDRALLPTYIFTPADLLIVIGQDGLVANTAKYVNNLPIIGVNPNPQQYDGILLPHTPEKLPSTLQNVLADNYKVKRVTMAEAKLNDGQRLLAFNDFYIGAASHVSSRYTISYDGLVENQSSSGIIISTGAGSTGWLSSVFNMACNLSEQALPDRSMASLTLDWEAEKLVFVVREPFRSKVTQATLGYGLITKDKSLQIESKMPTRGVIFSDGIEADFLHFNAGSKVAISLAREKACLVV
ncbi:sugar kinase [Roseivirga sp. BDSF3-8]|uniref:sugar kinase n=1 Tax=Roseivirga sp. BDSF3-8 TaxID=3241598 RepID=UPI003531C39D